MPLDPPRRASAALALMRWQVARRPWITRSVAVVLAATAGFGVLSAERRAERARAAWGQEVAVLVATGPIAPGSVLDGLVAPRRHPRPLVPSTAVHEVEVGSIARQHVAAGEVLVAADVAAPGGPASLIPAGWRAVAVAGVRTSRPPVSAGDGVAVVSGSATVAEGIVISVDDDQIVVAVPADVAAAAAGAVAAGEAAIVWLGEPVVQRQPDATTVSTATPTSTR